MRIRKNTRIGLSSVSTNPVKITTCMRSPHVVTSPRMVLVMEISPLVTPTKSRNSGTLKSKASRCAETETILGCLPNITGVLVVDTTTTVTDTHTEIKMSKSDTPTKLIIISSRKFDESISLKTT